MDVGVAIGKEEVVLAAEILLSRQPDGVARVTSRANAPSHDVT